MKFVRPLLALALATLSCQVILGFEEPQGVDGQPASGPDADAAPANVDPCPHALPPRKPAKDDDPATKKTYWLATVRVDVLKPDAGVEPGYDLDNACTCMPDLRDGGAPCRTPKIGVTCDRAGGIDDGLDNLAKASGGLPLPSFDYAEPLNADFAEGTRMLLLYLKDYNGKANDSDVSVDFAGSAGLFTNRGCNDEERPNPLSTSDAGTEGLPGPRYAPLNDGCDRWSPSPGQTLGKYPNRELRSTLAAYVTDFNLVVVFKEAGVGLFGGTTKLANGYAVARLSIDGKQKLHADGILAGRIGFNDLVDVVGRTPVADPTAGGQKKAFCETAFWPVVQPRLCETRDTMLSSADEFLDKTCDGTTMAFAFKMVEAQVSDVEFANREPPSTCKNEPVACDP